MDVAVDDDIHHGGGLRLGRRQEDGIDDVHHAIVGHDVGDGDLGVVDEDAVVVDGDGDVFAKECRGGGAIGEVSGQHLCADHVVEQDVGEAVEGQQVFCGGVEGGGQGDERVVGRGKDGERSLTIEGVDQPGSADGGFEEGVDVAVDDDIHHRGGRRVAFYDDGAGHAFVLGIVADPILVVIDARHVKRDRAHAIREDEEAVIGGQAERDRIVERISGIACFPVDAVPATIIDERHTFSGLNRQFGRVKTVVIDGHMVVAVALGECRGEAQAQREKGKEGSHGEVGEYPSTTCPSHFGSFPWPNAGFATDSETRVYAERPPNSTLSACRSRHGGWPRFWRGGWWGWSGVKARRRSQL